MRKYFLTLFFIVALLSLISFTIWQTRKPKPKTIIASASPQVSFFNKVLTEEALEEKIAKMFIFGFEDEDFEFPDINANHYLLLSRNIKSLEQTKALIAKIKSRRPEAMVFVDQEGGAVSRLAFAGFDLTSQAEIESYKQAFSVGKNRGGELADLGINVNLAPVLEVSSLTNSYISNRVFNATRMDLAEGLIKAMNESGVLAVVKHYPFGLGRTTADPHQSLPVINISREELINDLKPLKQLIEKGVVKGIMVTHLLYPQIDPNLPSSLSAEFYRILRQDLGFAGLIVTDDLSMKAITSQFSVAQASKKALLAGADMVIISGSAGRGKEEQTEAYQEVLEAVERREISEEKVEKSVEKMKAVSFDLPIR